MEEAVTESIIREANQMGQTDLAIAAGPGPH